MAELELCTDSAMGPYLIVCKRTAAELTQRFCSAGIPFERETPPAHTADDPGHCLIYLGIGANLATVSQLLNDGGYDWELAGM